MEGRGRSRARKRKFFSRKRLTSFLLAAAMVCTNIGSDLSTAYAAGSSTDVSFEMRGSDLVTAIEDAIATENVVTPDDLNFTNGKVDDFEGFLFGEGKLYEAYPEMEGGDVDADMRVFVRLPEDADDMYAVTGDEEVIFLYINNSDETVRFRSLINYTKDGEDKVKKTDWVSVRSYESVYGDEEVNVIPDQPETEETAETPETTVPETEAPVDETTEAPAEEDPIATDSEMTVSMSPNVAALVAAPGDDDVATPSEITGGEETADEPETTAPEESNEGLVDEGNLPEESDPATTPEESQPAEETTPVEETTEVPETTAPAKDPVATEDEIQSASKPDYSDLVGIGWSGTGKIYTSTLNKLHAFDDVEGWKVEYSITPEGSARIIDGARGVEDGEDLYFGVKNQIGYAVESVVANGEELTADTITDNEDGSQTAWYAVYGVTEEQSIDVVMAETGEHPAYSTELTMEDGTVIHIHAAEGVLPAGVEAVASVVTGIEDVVKENVEAEAEAAGEEKEVIASLSYNIDLLDAEGNKLDDQIWSGVVEVTFSGAPIEENSKDADAVEVMYVATTKEDEVQADIQAEDVVSVETVSDTVAVEADSSVEAVSFEAEHFSVYTVLFAKNLNELPEVTDIVVTAAKNIIEVGETTTVTAVIIPEDADQTVNWSSSNTEVATVNNGIVTALKAGTTAIRATSVSNENFYAEVTIEVEPVSVKSIEITGYSQDYMTVGDSVQLGVTVLPENAGNKTVQWESSAVDVLTVDRETGLVNAVGQGTATITARALDGSETYDEQTIIVYATQPRQITINLWVTNSDQNVDYTAYLPSDGSPITVEEMMGQRELPDNYVSTGDFRIRTWGNSSNWGNVISQTPTVHSFRYSNGQVQYRTSENGNWQRVGNYDICEFCEIVHNTESGSTDVRIILGDWPYDESHSVTNQTIEIAIFNLEEDGEQIYTTGTMSYDNGSDGQYGKIKFNVDESRYEVDHVVVEHSTRLNGNLEEYMTYTADELQELSDGISVRFQNGRNNHYIVKAYIKAKLFTVSYNANGGSGEVPETQEIKAINGNEVTVAASPKPTKEGFIFGGWQYNGTTYQGNESFEMPPEDVEFMALWLPASEVITYSVNNSEMGRVSRTFERVTGNDVLGSTAFANDNYRFVEWQDAEGTQVSTSERFVPDPISAHYIAIFAPANATINYVVVGGPDDALTRESEEIGVVSGVAVGSTAQNSSGYEFKGWYSDPECQNLISSAQTFIPTKEADEVWTNLTYYAKYEEIVNDSFDGPYVDGDNAGNNKNLYYQGSADVIVYLDGVQVQENTIQFGYEMYDCVDLALDYHSSDKYVLNAIYAIQAYGQSGANAITANLVDNVQDGSTVYIYLTTIYSVSYEVDQGIAPTDSNKYTIVNAGQKPNVTYNEFQNTEVLGAYKTETITVAEFPVVSGYEFNGWTDESSGKQMPGSSWALRDAIETDSNNNQDIHLVATATESIVTINYKSADTQMGTVSPAYEYVDSVSGNATGSTATAEEGYAFDNWTNADGEVVSWNPDFVPGRNADGIYEAATYTAHFAEDGNGDDIPDKYQIIFTYVTDGNGTIDGTTTEAHTFGDREEGFTTPTSANPNVNVTVTPNAGYVFDRWTDTEDGSFATDDDLKGQSYSSNQTFTAHMAEGEAVTITYVSENREMGTVDPGTESVNPVSGNATGSTATAEEGYAFDNWTNADGEVVSWNPDFVPGRNADGIYEAATYTAHFAEDGNGDDIPDKYQIIFTYVTDGNGTIDGTTTEAHTFGDREEGFTTPTSANPNVNVTVTPNAGYVFDRWTDTEDGSFATDDDLKGRSYSSNQTFTAHMAEGEAVTITYVSENREMGTVDPGTESVNPVSGNATGSTATAEEGYAFDNWTNADGEVVSWNPDFVPGRNADGIYEAATYTAHFAEDGNGDDIPDKYQIIFTYVTDGNGTIDGTTTEAHTFGDREEGFTTPTSANPNVNVTVTPNAGYVFDRWTDTEDGSFATDDDLKGQSYSSNQTFTAHMAEGEAVTITYVSENREMGTVDPGTESVNPVSGNATGSTATAEEGYAFDNWTNADGEVVSWNPDFVPGRNADGIYEAATYTAHFAEDGNGDDIPDKYQIIFTYVTDGNGTIDGTTTEAHTFGDREEGFTTPTSANPNVNVTVTPNAGYVFDRWTDTEDGSFATDDDLKGRSYSSNQTFTAHMAEGEAVTITYVSENREMGTVDPGTESVNPVSGNATGSTATAEEGYAFDNWTNADGEVVSWNPDFVPGRNADGIYEAATYTAHFAEDGNGDDIPDKYQIIFTYVTDGNGTIDGTTTEAHTFGDREEGFTTPTSANPNVNVTVTPNAGYVFDRWTDTEDGSFATDDDLKGQSYSSNQTFTAHMAEGEAVTITYVSENREMGTVDPGTESVNPVSGNATGSTATAEEGYAFDNWTNADGEVVSWNPDFVPGRNADGIYEAATYTAHFAEDGNGDDIPDKYQIIFTYVTDGNGTIDGTTTEAHTFGDREEGFTTPTSANPNVNVTVTPNAGYVFDRWTDTEDGSFATDDDLKGRSYSSNQTFTAHMAEGEAVTITYVSENREMGTVDPGTESVNPVSGNATGSTATAEEGYAFDNWTNADGEVVSWNPDFVPGRNADGIYEAATYTAHFAEDGNGDDIPDKYQIIFTYVTDGNGTIDGTTTEAHTFGDREEGFTTPTSANPNVNVTVTPNAGYVFDRWTDTEDGSFATDDDLKGQSYSSNQTFTAHMAEGEAVTITYVSENREMGTVDPGTESVNPVSGNATGSTATAEEGYAFDNWTNADGEVVSWNPDFVPGRNADGIYEAATYTAHFAEDGNGDDIPDKYQIIFTYVTDGNGTIDGTTTEAHTFGDREEGFTTPTSANPNVNVTVTPNAGYVFDRWTDTEDGSFATDDDLKGRSYSSNQTFTAHMAEGEAVTITYVSENREMGTVDPGTESVNPVSGNATGSTATAEEGYAFDNWTNADGEVVSWNPDFVPGRNADGIYEAATYTAHFAEDGNGDDIPDKYQIIFTYVTDGNGTIDGTTTEAHTFGDREEGFTTPTSANPNVNVTVTPNAGYVFDRWTDTEDGSFATDDDLKGQSYSSNQTFTAHMRKDLFGYSIIQHLMDETGQEISTTEVRNGSLEFETNILEGSNYQRPDTVEYENQNYVFYRIEGEDKTIGINADDNIVDIYYGLDVKGEGENPDQPDNIPDMYQITVVFAAVNGTFDESDTTQAERVVTLRDEDENLSEDGTYVFTADRVPASSPVTGYVEPGTWDRDPLATVLSKDSDNLTFTITYYTRDRFEAKVEFYFDGVCDDSVTQTSEEEYGLPFVIAPEQSLDHNDHHYVLESVENNGVVIGTDPEQNVVRVYYALDEIGEGEDPNTPDDTPDKYQMFVTFAAVNGTFDENDTTQAERVVTFKDEVGTPSEMGTYIFTADRVPASSPVTGYVEPGTWDRDPLTTVLSMNSGNLTFTITYYTRDRFEAKVEFYFDGVLDDSVTQTSEEEYGLPFVVAPEQSLDHNDHHYALESVENNGVVIGTDPDQNVIKVYYALDEIGEGEDPNTPDDTPDKYQMFVTFAAVNGTFDENDTTQAERVVTFKDEVGTPSEMGTYTFTEDRVPASSPITGYVEPGTWDRDPLTTVLSKDSDNLTFTITYYTRDRFEAKVEFYFDGVRDDSVTQTSEEEYGLPFVIAPEQSLDHNDHHYVLESVENNGVVIGTDPEQNVVKVYYVLDEKGGTDPENPDNPGPDDVPDKYQIVFTYVSADENTGTVTGITREVYTFKDAAGNYVENTGISPNAIEGHNPVADPAENYAFHYWTVQGQEERDYTVGMTFLGQKVYTTDTTFVAHFAEDKINDTTDGEDPNVPEDPNQPDGIPDIYQIVFTYVTEDATHGTVSGVVTEVRTFPRNGETGEYDTTAAISPNVGVTITAIGRYRFDNWTNGAGTVYDTDDLLRAAGFTEDQTFTAHFYRLSGGGSSGGGGGTITPGGPYNPGAGPGVTITEPEVPLAPLPTEGGGSTVIFDDNVPLAPLPKTGQQSLKTPITMLLAGIFLAFASLTKRKEEN